jgi:hypothetical protein
MISFEITADIQDDRRVVLTLPPEVPTGQAKLVVTVNSPASDNKRPVTSLADWVEIQPGQNASEADRYPLRGSVVRYDRPTDTVAEVDWEAVR